MCNQGVPLTTGMRKDNDGNEIGRQYYMDVPEGTEGAQHWDKEKRFTVSSGFIIVFIGILILNGAHFGLGSRSSRKLWQNCPYGLSIPYVWNAMRHNAYEFMRCFIHFADNSLDKPISSPGYDPLFTSRISTRLIGMTETVRIIRQQFAPIVTTSKSFVGH
jgi:hypothetical protein